MKIHFRASPAEDAQKMLVHMTQRYGHTKKVADADVIVSLGGDGETLRALQKGLKHNKPVFGLNFGHAGFLQNLHRENEDLITRIKNSEELQLSPLKIEAEDMKGKIHLAFAINEAHVCNH